ncbi:MAG: hypothetical protein QW794_07915 [Thermosphaera sp.]
MVKVSLSVDVTSAGEVDLFSVPGEYVAYLERLEVTNRAASPAAVQVLFYNGAHKKVVISKSVPAGGSVKLSLDELPTEGCPTKISVSTDQAPITVDLSVSLE